MNDFNEMEILFTCKREDVEKFLSLQVTLTVFHIVKARFAMSEPEFLVIKLCEAVAAWLKVLEKVIFNRLMRFVQPTLVLEKVAFSWRLRLEKPTIVTTVRLLKRWNVSVILLPTLWLKPLWSVSKEEHSPLLKLCSHWSWMQSVDKEQTQLFANINRTKRSQQSSMR